MWTEQSVTPSTKHQCFIVTLSNLWSDSRYRTIFRSRICRWLRASCSEVMIRKMPYRRLRSINSYCMTIRVCTARNCPRKTLTKLKRKQVDSIRTKYTVEHNPFNAIQKVLHVSVHQNHHRTLSSRQFTNTSAFATLKFFGSDNSIIYDYLLNF